MKKAVKTVILAIVTLIILVTVLLVVAVNLSGYQTDEELAAQSIDPDDYYLTGGFKRTYYFTGRFL